jgi:hypothetical protein
MQIQMDHPRLDGIQLGYILSFPLSIISACVTVVFSRWVRGTIRVVLSLFFVCLMSRLCYYHVVLVLFILLHLAV